MGRHLTRQRGAAGGGLVAAALLVASLLLASPLVAQDLSGPSAAAPEPVEIGADRGSMLWRSGDRDGAVAAWAAALVRGEPMRAVAWFEAALRSSPRMGDARFNLGLARADAGLGPRSGDGLVETLEAIARTTTPAEAEWLAVLAALLFAGVGLLEALRGGRWPTRLLLAAALVQPFLFAPLALHLLERGSEPFMVIDPAGVKLRAAPEDGAERVGALPAGSVVSYLDELPGWTKVRVGDEARWVPSGALFGLRL